MSSGEKVLTPVLILSNSSSGPPARPLPTPFSPTVTNAPFSLYFGRLSVARDHEQSDDQAKPATKSRHHQRQLS